MPTESPHLLDAVRSLYAVPPAEFVAERTARVKAARAEGDREAATAITALRRPTAGADAVNRVVHDGHPVIDDLRDVAAQLRLAQAGLDAVGIAELRGRRDGVIAAFLAAVAEVTEAPSAAVSTGVRDSVVAALADEAAQEVLCSGALTRTLSYSGFGEVDVSDAVARTSTGVLLTRLRGGAEAGVEEPAPQPPQPGPDPALVTRAREAVEATRSEVERTKEAVAQASRLLDQAQRRAEAARTAYERAGRDLADLTG